MSCPLRVLDIWFYREFHDLDKIVGPVGLEPTTNRLWVDLPVQLGLTRRVSAYKCLATWSFTMNNLISSKREAMSLIYVIPFGLGLYGFFEGTDQDGIMGFLNNDTVVYCFLGVGLVGMIIDLVLLYKKMKSNQKKAAEEDKYQSENELKDRHRNR